MEKLEHRSILQEIFKNVTLSKVLLNLIFIFALLMLVLCSFISYEGVKKLIVANRWVSHTYEVIQAIENSSYALIEMESNQRAYLLTGDNFFLSEMDITKSVVGTNLERLKDLTKDNTGQRERVTQFIKLVEKRLNMFNEVIQLKLGGKLATQEGMDLFNRSNDVGMRVKGLAKEIKSVESVLLQERNQVLIKGSRSSSLIIITGSIVSIFFIIIPFFLANKELANRKSIEQQNQNTQNHLRQIIESTTDMIAALDKENRFQIFNEAYQLEFKKLFNKSLTVGMYVDDAISEAGEAKRELIQNWKESLQPDEQIKTLEFQNEHMKSVYELSTSQIRNENNEVKGIVHSMRDITTRVQDHSKLQESYKNLALSMEKLQNKTDQITLLVEMSDILLASCSQEELSIIMSKYAQQLLSFSGGYLFIMHPSKNYLEQAASWGEPIAQELMFTPDQC